MKPLKFHWNYKALVVEGDVLGVLGNAIPDSVILTRKEIEGLTAEKDKEIENLRETLDLISRGVKDKIRNEASATYQKWKDDFCKRHDICPVCITGGYDCDSDHK